jgi:phosphatidylglycerophosphatase GEP4
VHPPLAPALAACLEAFDGAAVLLSNSAGLRQYDPDGTEADALASALGVPVLRHSSKKPGGTAAAVEAHFGCAASDLVMVGDRYFTDVLYGNRHGMLTVRPAPFAPRGDGRVVRAARALEDALVRRWRAAGRAPPAHARMRTPGAFVLPPQADDAR